MNQVLKTLPFPEFVSLLALMVSIVALAIDIMLPALDVIGTELNVAHPNDVQLIISALFLGFAVGQFLIGPLSDSFGRKPVVYVSYGIFIGGCLLSIAATDLTTLLIGRVLQGLGAAGPRIVTLAIVRDGYQGREMARIMSIVMSIFIIVPAIAPAIGQGILALDDWRAIFWFLLVLALITLIWFGSRQPETLGVEQRRPFSFVSLMAGVKELCRNRVVLGYTFAEGLIFGAFLAYLSSAQQVFSVVFKIDSLFPLFFGLAALAIGLASIINSKLVIKLGMKLLVHYALISSLCISIIFMIPVWLMGGVPPFGLFMVWLLATFFCVGILFGNFNALAMEPVGHMAGLGAAFVGSVSTFISLPLGWLIGALFVDDVMPLVLGFIVLAFASYFTMRLTEKQKLLSISLPV